MSVWLISRIQKASLAAFSLILLTGAAPIPMVHDWNSRAVKDSMILEGEEPDPGIEAYMAEEQAPLAGPASARVLIQIFPKHQFPGIEYEFGTMIVDGKFRRAFVISSARPGKVDPVDIPVKGKRYKVRHFELFEPEMRNGFAYPFHRSSSYPESITGKGARMFWGFMIRSLYWIHASPAYKELGIPASSGCIRLNYATANEIWATVLNEADGSARAVQYSGGSQEAKAAITDLFQKYYMAAEDLNTMIKSDLEDAHAVSKGLYRGLGHPRRDHPNPASYELPLCDGMDCEKRFGKQKL